MFNLEKTLFAGLVAATIAAPSFAQEINAAQRIEQFNTEMAVLAAELKKLEIEASIAQKRNDIQNLASSASGGNITPERESTPPPTIQSIEGVDEKLYATLMFRDGTTQIVRKNEVIKDGWKVTGLTATAVTLSRGREKATIGFGFPQQQQPSAAAPVGGALPFPGAL